MENTELLPLGTEQGREETEYSSFDLCLGESFVSPLVEQHRQWLKASAMRHLALRFRSRLQCIFAF